MPSPTDGTEALTEPGTALHELSRAIGALEAGVINLTKLVDEEREDASRHRQSLREVIGSLSEAVRALTSQEEAWKEDWRQKWQPLLEEYRQRRDEAAGRAKLGRWLLAGWIAIAGFLGAVVTRIFEHWR